MADPIFQELTVEVFMGGDFHLGRPSTVGELRQRLREMEKELEGWGDTTEISEVWAAKNVIQVNLKHGISK